MATKQCFVISPIGQPGTEVREHADDVFDYIIKPAMDEVGIGVYRADHDPQAGRITDHMFESILNDDLCIAVLSFQNPNVYYELAVAQSAARPVIILNLKGNPLPFDIKDLRVIEYDFRPKSIMEKVYVKQIVEMVRNLEARNWVVSVPFGTGLSPLGRGRGALIYRERLESYGPTDDWLGLLARAERAIDLSGMHLRYWTKMIGFRATVVRKAEAGCRVRFLIMHQDNPAVPQYFNPQLNMGAHLTSRDFVAANAYLQELAAAHPNIRARQIRAGCHHQQLVRVDDRMFVSLIVFSETTRRCPLIECTAQSTFFQAMETEFDALWDANAEPPAPRPATADSSANTIPQ